MDITLRQLRSMGNPPGFVASMEDIYPLDYRIPLAGILQYAGIGPTLHCLRVVPLTDAQILALQTLAYKYTLHVMPMYDAVHDDGGALRDNLRQLMEGSVNNDVPTHVAWTRIVPATAAAYHVASAARSAAEAITANSSRYVKYSTALCAGACASAARLGPDGILAERKYQSELLMDLLTQV